MTKSEIQNPNPQKHQQQPKVQDKDLAENKQMKSHDQGQHKKHEQKIGAKNI